MYQRQQQHKSQIRPLQNITEIFKAQLQHISIPIQHLHSPGIKSLILLYQSIRAAYYGQKFIFVVQPIPIKGQPVLLIYFHPKKANGAEYQLKSLHLLLQPMRKLTDRRRLRNSSSVRVSTYALTFPLKLCRLCFLPSSNISSSLGLRTLLRV